VWEILKNAGIDPAPRQTGPTWSLFLRSQAEAILACDFFTASLLDGTQAYVLAVIEHASRRIRILGVTLHPTGEWTAQQARNLLMDLGEQAHRVKFMIRDRGSNFTGAFDAVLADAGVRTVLCNVQTPRMNAIIERWIGGCRRELLDRTLVWNQTHLRQILRAYEIHHNQHRPHRSLDAAAPLKPLPEPVDLDRYRVRRQAHTACLINEYRLVALRGRGFWHAHVKFVLHDRDATFTVAFDAVFQAAGARVVRCAVQAPRMNSIMERWVGSCRRELLDRTLIWNQRHLMTVLREYEDFYNTHRPHRTLNQAAPLRPLPDRVTDLDHFRVRRRDRAGGVIHEYRLVA
jgi:Integrase core domain